MERSVRYDWAYGIGYKLHWTISYIVCRTKQTFYKHKGNHIKNTNTKLYELKLITQKQKKNKHTQCIKHTIILDSFDDRRRVHGMNYKIYNKIIQS